MGHHIHGIVFPESISSDVALIIPNAPSAPLGQGFRFLPLTEELFDGLRAAHPDIPDRKDHSTFELLSGPVEHVAARLSANARIAYIETDYHGGSGAQSSMAWDAGRVVVPPQTAPIGPINSVLSFLGVRSLDHRDEFAAVGLDRHRETDDWAAEAASSREAG